MTVLLPFRHSELDSESRSFLLSGHPDVLPVSILVFAKNGYRRQEPVSHHFRGLSSLPVMPDTDPASPVLQKSKRARSRLRAQRDDISGVLRDDPE